jgi:hypothetical protein
MATASDSFTYSNGDLATVSSAAWTTLGGNGMTVASNHISQGVLNNDSGAMWAGAFGADHFSQATISTTGTGTYQDLEVSTRAATTGPNYYLASVTNSGTGVEFYLRQGASFTSTGANLAYTGTHVARLESNGNTHTFFVDTVSSRTWTDSTLAGNTHVGIAGFTQAVGNVTLDDWSGGDLGGGAAFVASGPAIIGNTAPLTRASRW